MAPACGSFEGRSPVSPTVDLWGPLAPNVTYFKHNDTFVETNGCIYRQLFQEFPVLRPFYTEYEINFNSWPYWQFAERYFVYAWLICAAYLLFLIVGSRFMANREKFGWKGALQLWNLGLAVFSIIGFLRTAPHLLYYLYDRGFYSSVCSPGEPAYGQGAAGLWTMFFIFSKIPELGDTVFIIFRKTPLIFLHWYHHVTVLLFCWHSYATRSSAGLYFVAMNYGVHALMYFYYFLKARGIRVAWDQIVTTLQISQMFVGMFICAAVHYYQTQGLTCDIRPENYWAGLVMYGSYAALFIAFFVEKYFTGKSSFEKKKPAAAPAVSDAVPVKEVQTPTPDNSKAAAASVKEDDAPVSGKSVSGKSAGRRGPASDAETDPENDVTANKEEGLRRRKTPAKSRQ